MTPLTISVSRVDASNVVAIDNVKGDPDKIMGMTPVVSPRNRIQP